MKQSLSMPKIEMFARQVRPGWDAWGNGFSRAAAVAAVRQAGIAGLATQLVLEIGPVPGRLSRAAWNKAQE